MRSRLILHLVSAVVLAINPLFAVSAQAAPTAIATSNRSSLIDTRSTFNTTLPDWATVKRSPTSSAEIASAKTTSPRNDTLISPLPAWFAAPLEKETRPDSAQDARGGLPNPPSDGFDAPSGAIHNTTVSALPAWFAASPIPTQPASPRIVQSDKWQIAPSAPQSQTTNPIAAHQTIYASAVTVTGTSPINNCDVVTYTIIAATDDMTTTGVVITSAMPSGFTPQFQVFDIGELGPTQTVTATAVFTANCSAVSGQNIMTLTQDTVAPIVKYTDFVVLPGAITVRKEPSVIKAGLDDIVTWTVYVDNTGYGKVSNVNVTDTLGSGLQYVSGLTTTYIAALAVGESISFPVSARVIGCANLDNNVVATWGCADGNCLTPQTAKGSVDLQVRVPKLSYSLPTFNIPFCATTNVYTIPVTNNGDTSAVTPTLSASFAPFSITVASLGATYNGSAFTLPTIPAGGTYNLVFTLTHPANICTMAQDGSFNFGLNYYDRCNNIYYEAPQAANWQLTNTPGQINVGVSLPSEIYRGDNVTSTVSVNQSGLIQNIVITQQVPSGWSVVNADGGHVFTLSNIAYITWTATATNSLTFNPVFGTPGATITGCQACGLPATTVVTATSSDCQSCQRTDTDWVTTYVQCHEPVLTSAKSVSAPASVCANPAFTFTNTYNFTGTFAVTPTWQSMRFTETLSYQTYISGSASVWLARSGVTTTAVFSQATIGGQLIIYNISPTIAITVPGSAMWISYTTAVSEPNACYGSTFYDWSYLNIGVTGNQQCSTNGVLQEGVFVTTQVPSMTLSLSGLPSTVSDCGEYTITLTARRTSTLAAYDAVIDVPTNTYSILDVVGFTGADPILTTTDASGYHFYYADTFATTTQAAVQLHVKLRCGSPSVKFDAQLYYDNLCANNDTYRERCSTGGSLASPATIDPLLILSKYPEVIYAQGDVVTWTLTVVNSGAGPAYDVTLTDTLGSGLRYYASSITSDQGSVAGVTPITSTNVVTWFLPVVKPKEKVTIIYAGEIIGCTDLTNQFSGAAGCLGQTCLTKGPVVSHVELPPTILLNTNQTVTPIDTCFTRTVTVTVRNAGLLSVYTSTVTETLPTGLNYVAGSTEVSTDQITWQAAPDPTINGQNLSWSPTSGAPLDSLLARIRPGVTVYVRFSVRASCPFAGGQLRVQTRYQDTCGTPYSTNASYFVMQQREANLSIVKAGVNLSRTSPSGQLVYGEPGEPVMWYITVTNASNAATAPLPIITDTLPDNVIFNDATPGYSGIVSGSIGGTLAWSLPQIVAGQTVVFTVSTTISDTNSCTIVDTRNRADLTWGCPSDGCRQSKSPVYANLRTRPVESIALTTEISPTAINQCGGPVTITLRNDGPPAYNVTVTDTLPAGFIYSDTLSISTPASTTIDLGQSVVYTWPVLPSGDTIIVVWAKNNAPSGTCAAPSGDNIVAVTYDDHLVNCTNTAQYAVNDATTLDVRSPNLVVDKQPATQITTIGQQVTWTLSLTNTGTGTAYNVVITDLVGSSYIMPAASLGSDGAVPTFDGNTITWTLAPLAADGVWSATVSGVVTNTGDNRNRVIVTSRCDTGCTSSNATSTAYSTLLDTFSKGPKIQTDTIGSLAVFNFHTLLPDTDAVYGSINFTDSLPAGLGYQSSALTYFYDNGTGPIEIDTPTSAPAIGASGDVLWALGSLSGTVIVDGMITTTIMNLSPLNQNGVSHTNHMTMTYFDLGQEYVFSDTARVDVVEPALSLSKAVATSTGATTNLDGNALITYTLRLTNSGTSPAYSIRLTDAIPSGISVTAQFGGDASSGPVVGANNLTWLINSIGTAPDNVIEVTYTARISQALANTNLINVVTGTYWSLTETVPQARSYGPLTDSRTVSTSNVNVYKSSAPTTLRVGDVTTYSLVFTVPAGLIGMGGGNSSLIDTLPTGLQFVTDTETLTWSPPEVTVITTSRNINNGGAQQLVNWYFDAITSTLDEATIVTLTLQAQATGVQINTGATVFSPPSAVYAPVNNVSLWQRGSFVGSSTAQNRVIQPVLSIAKSVTPAANSYVGSNQPITYTLAVANSSNGPAYDIVISDVLPSSVIFDSSIIDNGNFDQQPTLGATGTITWQVTTLDGTDVAASPRFTITVYAHVDADIAANLTLNNSAFLTYYDSEPGPGVTTALGTVQRTYSDGSSSTALRTVNGGIGKSVTFSPPPTATLGTLVTYTLSAPQTPLSVTLYTVQITDTINPSMTIVSVDTAGVGNSITQTGQLITATFTSVPSYTQAYVTVTARIDTALNARTGTLISNTAYLTHSTATALTNTQTVTTLVGEPTLTVTKRVASSAGNVNAVDGLQTLTYTIRLTNTGTSPAYDVVITDMVPQGISVTALFGSYPHGDPVQGLNPLTWTVATISNVVPNNAIVLSYTARISGAVASNSSSVRLTNTVTSTWSSLADVVVGERNYGPITATAAITPARPGLIKSVSPTSNNTTSQLKVGDVITYSIVVTVPPRLIVWWPYMYDDLPVGVRLITPSLSLTSTLDFTAPDPYASAASYASSPNGVLNATSTSNPRVGQTEATAAGESIEWWLDPLDNSQSDATGYVTMTFRAQLTGIGRNGTPQWTDALAMSTLANTAYLYWNASDQGAYVTNTLTQTVNANVNSYVGQPLLHINKTYTTPAVCSGGLLEDAFNSSSTTLANWTNITDTWTINTSLGQAVLSAGTVLAGTTVRNALNISDFSYSAQARSTDTASSLGLIFRYTNASNYYLYRVRINDGGNNVQLQKLSAGSLTTLYTVTVTPSANRWYNLEVRAEGNRLRGYLDGVQQFDVTDNSAPLTAGQIGLYANNCAVNSCAFDDVFVTKLNATACPINASDLVTYTLTITNHGTTPAYDVVISDALPAELTYVSSALLNAPSGTTLDTAPALGATGALTWSVNYLSGTNPSTQVYGNMRTLQLQIVAQVTDTVAANARFSNQVFAPYYDTQPDSGPIGTTVLSNDADQRTYSSAGSHSAGLQTPDGGIAKTYTFDPPPTVTLGSLITYTLRVPTSAISATLYNVQITDTLHPSMTLVPSGVFVSGGSGSIVVSDSQRVTATFASIVSNTFAYVTITARVLDNLRGYAGYSITNTAYLSHSTASAITNTGIISTPIGEPALSIGKLSDPVAGSSVGAGQTVTYTVLITNAPSSTAAPAYDLIFTDTLPQWMRALDPQLITITLDGVPIDPIEYTATYVAGTGVYVIDFSSNVDVPVGSVLRIQYAAVVEAEVPSGVNLTNQAQVSWTSLAGEVTGERTYGPINTSVTLNTLVPSLIKQVTPAYATLGDLITYTLIAPATPISATLYDVVLTDTLDARTAAIDTIFSGGAGGLVTTTSDLITATFSSVPSYTQAIVTVTVRVPSNLGAVAGQTITNRAWLRDAANSAQSNQTTFTITEPSLTLVKASNPPTSSTLGAGDTITYALTLTNRNTLTTSAAHDVIVTDTLPLHLRGLQPTITAITLDSVPINPADYAASFDAASGVYTVAFGSTISILPNSVLVIQYAAVVENTVPPGYDLINRAQAAYDSQLGVVTGERAYVTNIASTTLHTAQPSIGKSVSPLFATLGDLITYTLRVPDTPVNMTIYNATITDTLNVSTTFVAVNTSGGTGATTDQAGQVITANFATIPAFSQAFVMITVRLPSSSGAVAGDTINNQATLSHTAGVTQSNVTSFRVIEPSLSIAKGSTPVAGSTVGAGDAVIYSVFITNANGSNVSPAHDLVITDTLPLYMRGTSPVVNALTINGTPVVDYATTYDATSGVFTVTLASNINLATGEALRLDYQAVVDANVPAATNLINQARAIWSSLAGSITGERAYGPIAATTTLHSGQPTLGKSATPSIVSLGSTVVFTLSVPGSPLGAVLNNVAVTDTIDSRLRVESTSANATFSGQLVTATFASIASFAQETVTITATVLNLPTTTNGTLIANGATLNYTNNPGGLVASPIVTLTVHEPHVTLAKSVTTPRTPVGAGDMVTYTLTLNNTGNWPAHDLIITDALPSELTFIATTGINVSDPVGAITGGDYPQWTIDQVNAGGTATIAFTARVADSIGARVTLTNSAWGAYDSQPGVNVDQRPYTIVTATAPITTGDPAFTIVKSATPSPVNAGDPLAYTIRITNTGLVTATGVIITDAVPANTTFVSASDPHTLNANVVSWSIGTLGVGASASVTLVVNVNSPLFNSTSITNTAYVTSTEGVTGNSTIIVPVNAAHTLDLVKSVNVDHAMAGRALTYTIAYTITGNEPALNVTISDTVPPSTTYQACGGATCNQAAGLVTWSIGTVTPIGTGVVTLVLLVNSDVPTGTLIANRAAITDTSGLIATSEVTVPVWSLPSFAITKTTAITLAHANRPITYTIVVTNTGPGFATETVITDELPISTTFSSCGPAPCTPVGSIVSWTIGTLTPTMSVAVTLIVIANSDVPSDTFLYNDHYGVTCAELPTTTGTPVQVPTNVRLQSLNARLSDTTNWGNLIMCLTLTVAAAFVWRVRRTRR